MQTITLTTTLTFILLLVGCTNNERSLGTGSANITQESCPGTIVITDQPRCLVVLAQGQNAANIVFDDTNLYWTSNVVQPASANCRPSDTNCGQMAPPKGMVMQIPKSGGSPTTLASGQKNPNRLAVDATSVYWINLGTFGMDNTGSVLKVSKGGGTPFELAPASDPLGLVVDAANVYWTEFFPRDIKKIPIGGSHPSTTPTQFATCQGTPTDIAVDSTDLYWVYDDFDAIVRMPLDSSSAATKVVDLYQQHTLFARNLLLDETSLYWSITSVKNPQGESPGAVMRAGKDGSNPQLLANAKPKQMAIDSTHVYWTDKDNAVHKVSKDGSTVSIAVIPPGRYTEAIAVDETSIYYSDIDPSNPQDGRVLKLWPK